MPAVASKNAYSIPLMVCVVYVAECPLRVSPVKGPAADVAGSIPCSPFVLAPSVTVKPRTPPLHESEPNDEASRPSSHCSIWRPETTGTPRALAEAMIASDPLDAAVSVCILAVNAP